MEKGWTTTEIRDSGARFTLVHSHQAPRSCTGAPWIRLTRRILDLHDPGREILVTSAGMLHYDVVLREWLERGGWSDVILPEVPEKWLAQNAALYSRFLSHPRINLSGAAARSGGGVGLSRSGLQTLRDELVLTTSRIIEAGYISPAGRMQKLIRFAARSGAVVHRRRLTLAESVASTTPIRNKVDLPAELPGFEDYIWHFTRGRAGPWPDESMKEYTGDLLGYRDPAPYTAEAALRRILSQKQLAGSSGLIRGGYPVVCFTGASWRVIRTLFTWQMHLRRPRFEPFAIGFRKSCIYRLGIVPVIYGPVAIYRTLPECERWRFQKNERGASEWVAEAEWRCRGKLDLTDVSAEEIAVMTPGLIRNLTDWQ